MATGYIIDLDHRDDSLRLIQKCNHNFRMLMNRQSGQSTQAIIPAGLVTGVKGEMQQDYETGDVSIALEETGENILPIEVLTIWDEIINPT